MSVIERVFDKVRLFETRKTQSAGPFEFIMHRTQDCVSGRLRPARHRTRNHQKTNDPLHSAPPSELLPGGGKSGGRSLPLSFFWISISETSSAGDTAETGTLPDSAPQ